jgi:hypothetical protein
MDMARDHGGGWTAVALAVVGRWHWSRVDDTCAWIKATQNGDLDVVHTGGWLQRVYCFACRHPETLEALHEELVAVGVPMDTEEVPLEPRTTRTLGGGA